MGGLGKKKPGWTPPPPPEPSLAERHEHEGRTPQPGVPAGPRDTEQPSASGFEYSPETYEKTGLTPPTESRAEAHDERVQEYRAERAAARQKRIVQKYVTKAYEPKKAQGFFDSLGSNVEQAKSNVSKAREELLSHPAIQKANEEGKVVGPKGLTKIKAQEKQSEALSTKSPLAHFEQFYTPAGERHNPFESFVSDVAGDVAKAAKDKWKNLENVGGEGSYSPSRDVGQGISNLTKNVREAAKESYEQETFQGGHNPMEPPSIKQSIAAAEIGLAPTAAGDVLSAGQTATKAGATLFEGGAKEAATAGAARVGAKAAASREAIGRIPGFFTRDALKEGAKALPGAAKSAPAAVGRAGLRSSERGLHSVAGIGTLGAASKAGVNVPGGTIFEGQKRALEKDPLKVLSSTANLAPSLLISAFQLPVAAGKSAIEGDSAPLEGALAEQKNFFEHFAKTYGGSDPKAIEKATLEEGLLPEVLLGPVVAKGIKELGTSKVADIAKGKYRSRRAPLTDESGNVVTNEWGIPAKKGTQRHPNETRLTRGSENAHLRREEARHAGKTEDIVNVELGRRVKNIEKQARKAAGKKVTIREGLGRKGKEKLEARPTDFIPFLNRAAIDLSNPDAALREIQHYADMFKGQKSAAELGANPSVLNGRDAANYFLAHPDELESKHLARALAEYRDMANGKNGLASLSTSERNRYLGVAAAHDIPLPEERAPASARDLTSPKAAADALMAEATRKEGLAEQSKRPKTAKRLRDEAEEIRAHAASILKRNEASRRGAWAHAHSLDAVAESARKSAQAAWSRATGKAPWEVSIKERHDIEKKIRRSGTPEQKAALRQAHSSYKKARKARKQSGPLKNELSPYTRPGAKANRNAKRLAYGDIVPKGEKRPAVSVLEKEFADEVRGELKKRGLHPEPAYVPDTSAVARAEPDQSATGGQKALGPGPQINEGYVFKHGLQVQGYEHLLNGVQRSVAAHHWYENGRRFRAERAIEYKGTVQHTSKEWAEAFQHGVISEKDVDLVPTQALNRLERAMQGGTPSDYAEASAALSGAAVKAKEAVPGTKYEAYPSAAYQEFAAQAQKAPVASWLRSANMVTSRAMLSTPSFVAAQVIAETAQAVADVNPARMAQGLYNYSKLSPSEKAAISGVSGETGRAIFSPNKLGASLANDGKPMKDALGFFRRNLFGRSAKDIVTMKWAGQVNRFTSGLTRRAVLTGEIMRDLNGLQRHGRALLHAQTELQKEIGHLSGKQQLEYFAKHPEALDTYHKKLGGAMGLWNNLTRTGHFPEVYRAAGLIFYPFLRMSVLWPLKFAVNHPIKATALAYLAAQNNFALREALHGEPSFLNYAQVPLYGRNPKTGKLEATSLINLSRMSPGGNAITQAVQGTGSPIGAVQPVIGAAVLGFTGEGAFGPVEGGFPAHLRASAASIASLSPYIRAIDTALGQKASGQTEFGIFAKRANIAVEPLQALETKLKGPLGEQLFRSLGNPTQPLKISLERDKAKLGKVLGELGKYGSDAQSKVQATSRGNERATRNKVIQMQKRYDKAKEGLNALYKKYGLEGVAKRSEEIYFYTHPYPGSTEKKSPFESGGFETDGSAFEGGWGGGEEKPPAFPNKGTGLNLPGLNLGAITGAITSPLSSLIGGTPAQAAELTKGAKAPAGKPGRAKPPKHKEAVVSIQGPLTSSQKTFGKELVKLTGLDPKTVGGWLLAEDSYTAASSKQAEGDANWLNIGPGYDLGSNPKQAAQYTANLINTSDYYGGIRSSVGKGVGAQVAAIQASPWDGAHYPNGIPTNLVSGKGGDAVRGRNKQVYVRADAKGMVQWAKANLGTQEGSTKQLRWATKEGLGSTEPWCANFVSNGLARRGVTPPSNPNATESYEIWGREGKYASVVPGISKAKPGDVLTFSGEHTALYVGNGEMISGNFSDEVERTPVSAHANLSMIIRPKYKGGKVKMKAGPALPSTIPSGTFSTPSGDPTQTAIAAYSTATGTPEKQVKKELKTKELKPGALLKQVERIYAGQLPGGVIPGFSTRKEPDLAAIGRAVEESRRKLLAA